MMPKLVVVMVACLFIMSIAVPQVSTGWVKAQTQERPEYVSPQPGARFVSPRTTIAIRPGEFIDPRTLDRASFDVVGTKSGIHHGSAILADDGKTIVFKPAQPFALAETVTVVLNAGVETLLDHVLGEITFDFVTSARQTDTPSGGDSLVASDERSPVTSERPSTSPASRAPAFVTLPPDYPALSITAPATGTADGYVFMAPFISSVLSGTLLILDDAGQPIYYKKLAGWAADFKQQPNGLLTYWTGGQFYAMDNTYNIVDTYQAGNGYVADVHDLQLLPNGHALLLVYDNQTMDLSQIVQGGYPTATVMGLIVQELDTLDNVVFEWHSWDHFLITDTLVSLTTPVVDYVHGNAVELDADGHLLISSRNLSEITKINRQTGDIIWRLGGKDNQFIFGNGASPIDTQHDIRRLPNGNITLFNNRANLQPAYSSGEEYRLDEEAKTATLVWDYRNTPDIYAAAMGNVQRLPGGNTVIGWGTGRMATEMMADGSKAFEVKLPVPYWTYRAFRFPWHGYPSTPPTLITQTTVLTTELFYSWNGATDISSYRIYAGNDPHPTTLIATAPKTGFEEQTVLPNASNQCRYFRVMPIDKNRLETQYSNEVSMCYGSLPAQLHLPVMLR
ncbi:MAG: aryl-sulfate sulfotransferase [Chloroflexi bacterium]|nr:aryl-sulfate sulfotransferase [Chloroflexota bacterium]